MRNLIGPFLLVIFAGLPALGQTNMAFEENYPEARVVAGLYADYFVASDAITVEFQNAYLRGDFIDAELKDRSLEKHDDRNRVASVVNGGAFVRWRTERFLGMDSLQLFAGLHYRSHFSSRYPRDLFHTYFYGNRPFEGETADLSDFRYLQVIYQQLQFGIMRSIPAGKGRVQYAASLSFLNGQDYLEITTTDGALYTHTDAEYLDLNLSLEARQSDTLNQDLGSMSGLGLSASGQAWYEVEDDFSITIAVTDMGVISWNADASSFEVDTNYHFEGVLVDNLLDSLYLDLKSETEFKEGFKKNRSGGSFAAAIPATVSLAFTKHFNGLLSVSAGGNWILDGTAIPRGFVTGQWRFGMFVRAWMQFSYGGYSGMGMGVGFDADLGGGFVLSAGAPYLNGYLTRSTGTAQGGFAGLKKIF